MALPPHAFGSRAPTVRLEKDREQRWLVTIDDRRLSPTSPSEGEARSAAAGEVARLDALALALLRRIRASLNRKRR